MHINTASVLLVAVIASLAVVQSAITGDLISSLPGYGAPPTAQYSGLIPVDSANSLFLHYWFVESAGTPSTDPVVVWLNGGPGCSSLEGFLFELGPLHFTGEYDSSNVPTLMKNPYAWTNIANVLFIESPAGVGFSYAVNGSTYSNDEITSQNSYSFLINWFKGFPEFAKNPFYITGESYAGIYVPTLADRIRIGNGNGQSNINLLGFAVGNGCWGNAVGTCAFQIQMEAIADQFYYGHALYSQDAYATIVSACGSLLNPNYTNACQTAIDNQYGITSNDINNIYDIYDNCPNPVSQASMLASQSKFFKNKKPSAQAAPPQCIQPNTFAGGWLGLPSVQTALHVTAANVTNWQVCNLDVNSQYGRTQGNLLPLYPTLIKAYKVLIYSGDTDGCVPHVGSEQWTAGLGFSINTDFAPWTFNNGQVGGYVTQYNANGFTYATVKGAGHMVPQYQPAAAFQMFSNWITNGQWN